MKHILCYGDSNTFGTDPIGGGRHPLEVRWTGRLQALLGAEYRVIEEGMGGRTTVFADAVEPYRCGLESLYVALTVHRPIDLVVIMLGTNDLKQRFHITKNDIGRALARLLKEVQDYPFAPKYPAPKVLVVSPVLIKDGVSKTFGSFNEEAPAMSRYLREEQQTAAAQYGAYFFDAAEIAEASDEDKLHMNAENHEKLAQALAPFIRKILE